MQDNQEPYVGVTFASVYHRMLSEGWENLYEMGPNGSVLANTVTDPAEEPDENGQRLNVALN